MKITLVALYDLYSNSIRGLHSYLEQGGHEVNSVFYKLSTYTDEPYTEAEIDELVNVIRGTEPDMIGIGFCSPLFQLFKKLSKKLRDNIGCPILVGGAHPTAAPESCKPYADYICWGEGEESALALCNNPSNKIPGIWPNRPIHPIADLDILPLPHYGDNTHYVCVAKAEEIPMPLSQGKISIYSSRGCPYACTFCHETLLKKLYINPMISRRKKVDTIIDEIKFRQKTFPDFTEVSFPDAIFARDDVWIDEFCEKFTPLNCRFRVFGHAAFASKNILQKLKNAGLLWISFGIQSASDKIRKIFGRTESTEKILECSRICKEIGIIPRWDFIIFNPFDDAQSVGQSRRLIHKLKTPCVIREFRLRFFPGTEITKRALEERLIPSEDVEGTTDQFGNWSYFYTRHNTE